MVPYRPERSHGLTRRHPDREHGDDHQRCPIVDESSEARRLAAPKGLTLFIMWKHTGPCKDDYATKVHV